MADLEDLLVKTSRTFALSIPQLPGETRTQVTLGYLELLEATGEVLAAYEALEPAARSVVGRYVRRTCVGMAHIVRRADRNGDLRLADIPDL